MIKLDCYDIVQITEIGSLERAKSQKTYEAGSTLIALSATRGQLEYLSETGTVSSRYAVLTPLPKYNRKYIYISMQEAFPEFIHRVMTGINLQFENLKEMQISVHNRETQDYIVSQIEMVDAQMDMENIAIQAAKDIKKYFLDGMFV